MMVSADGPLLLFVSYSRRDDDLRAELEKHLELLRRQGLITAWHDRHISAGADWKGQIDEHLESARIILLLVSADFMASGYCYDIEMKRALERHATGNARVVPIILRPVDWKSAPFAALQCLPRDGKAVTLWSNRDEAFADVATGLRQTVSDLRGGAPEVDIGGDQPVLRRRSLWRSHRARFLAVIMLALGAVGSVPWLLAQRRHVKQGEAYLNVGRYPEAKDAFRRALSINPWSGSASWGIDKASVMDLSDAVAFEHKVRNDLYARRPNDPHVNVYMGDLAATQRDIPRAIQHYQIAVKAEPDLAEAYFRMGVLYDQTGDSQKAEQMYLEAVKRSATTPRYRNNLAYLLAKKGPEWYDRAIEEYGRNDRYPLSAIEAALLSWFKGDVSQARDFQQQAVEWLEDVTTSDLLQNRGPWYFELGAEGIDVVSLTEKQSLAYLSLSASVFLLGDQDLALHYRDKARTLGGPRFTYIRHVVEFSLTRLVRERPTLAWRVGAFLHTVLGASGIGARGERPVARTA